MDLEKDHNREYALRGIAAAIVAAEDAGERYAVRLLRNNLGVLAEHWGIKDDVEAQYRADYAR